MKRILKDAWPALASGGVILSLFAFVLGLATAIKPELLGFPTNFPLYLRVLAGIGGVAIHVAAWLGYYRSIGVSLIVRK